MVELGARVKAIRLSKNLTLRDLAFKINKDPQSIHRLEVGGINPSFLYITDVCAGLGVGLEELVRGLGA